MQLQPEEAKRDAAEKIVAASRCLDEGVAMSSVEGPPSVDRDILDVLDLAAELVIEARALLMTLPADGREELRVLSDMMLMALGRRIATELPPSLPTVDES